jgi:hypothetical protein
MMTKTERKTTVRGVKKKRGERIHKMITMKNLSVCAT